jgi:endoglucanase
MHRCDSGRPVALTYKDSTVEQDQREFLRRLLNAPGPSGFESIPAGVWREEAAKFADVVDHDVIGNSYATLRAESTDITVAVVGHIDEIGFLITRIDEQGFLWFEKVGGWDDQVVVGARVLIVSRNGQVRGVIGKKAAHLLKPADRDNVTSTDDLWIDVGAKDRAAAKERVEIGDPVVLDTTTLELTDDLWSSRSLDNRVGAFVALETIRILSQRRPRVHVIAAAVTQEEITFAGAVGLSNQKKPHVGIAVDLTHATDYPNAGKYSDTEIALGGGPTIARGASANEVVFRGLQDAAKALNLNAPIEALPKNSGTDADALRSAGANIAPGVVSVPGRYMHSPNETVSLTDIDNAAKLIAEYILSLGPDSDFRP